MTSKKDNAGLTFTALAGQGHAQGVEYAVDAEHEQVYLRVPYGAERVAAAPPSTTGKSKLIGNTGGYTQVPGTPAKVNLVALVKG
jgi:hypothetical protein